MTFAGTIRCRQTWDASAGPSSAVVSRHRDASFTVNGCVSHTAVIGTRNNPLTDDHREPALANVNVDHNAVAAGKKHRNYTTDPAAATKTTTAIGSNINYNITIIIIILIVFVVIYP